MDTIEQPAVREEDGRKVHEIEKGNQIRSRELDLMGSFVSKLTFVR